MKRKHSRLHTREARLRHIARMMRLAELWGLSGKAKLIHSKDRVPCSCPMCGNPRKWWGEKPYQELKVDLQDEADYDE